jgi:hypothetical protein
LDEYPQSNLAGGRGSRLGVPARKAVGFGLCLAMFAGLAAACGSSKPSAQPNLTPSAEASASFDRLAYAGDTGGFGTVGMLLADAGYTKRYEDLTGLDHMAEAYFIIEQGLPRAVDLNEVKSKQPATFSFDVSVTWEPKGRRDTVLPPGGHGERIYSLDVDLGPYVKGGDAVAYVWFLSRAEGEALASQDAGATPASDPKQAFSFKLDKKTASALLDLFWVKGEPAAS